MVIAIFSQYVFFFCPVRNNTVYLNSIPFKLTEKPTHKSKFIHGKLMVCEADLVTSPADILCNRLPQFQECPG